MIREDPSLSRLQSLPGSEIVLPGLDDLRHSRTTPEALLVEIAALNLERAGIALPPARKGTSEAAEIRLYRLLCERKAEDAYGLYNSLLRRLARFERALRALET